MQQVIQSAEMVLCMYFQYLIMYAHKSIVLFYFSHMKLHLLKLKKQHTLMIYNCLLENSSKRKTKISLSLIMSMN